MAESRRFPSRAPNRAVTVQRFIQQTIRDVKEGCATESAEYRRGWREACDACVEAFQDQTDLEDTLQQPNPANVGWGDKREKS
jgi:hypothetical protein